MNGDQSTVLWLGSVPFFLIMNRPQRLSRPELWLLLVLAVLSAGTECSDAALDFEIPKDAVLMADWSLDLELAWVGGKQQGAFSFGRDARNQAILTPADDNGKLAFHMLVDGKLQSIVAPSALPKDSWHRIQVVLSGDTGKLFVDGTEIAVNRSMTHNPEDLRATVCYLGRGFGGNFFRGMIDEVSIYSTAIVIDKLVIGREGKVRMDHGATEPGPAESKISKK